jgi:hypothetical protein
MIKPLIPKKLVLFPFLLLVFLAMGALVFLKKDFLKEKVVSFFNWKKVERVFAYEIRPYTIPRFPQRLLYLLGEAEELTSELEEKEKELVDSLSENCDCSNFTFSCFPTESGCVPLGILGKPCQNEEKIETLKEEVDDRIENLLLIKEILKKEMESGLKAEMETLRDELAKELDDQLKKFITNIDNLKGAVEENKQLYSIDPTQKCKVDCESGETCGFEACIGLGTGPQEHISIEATVGIRMGDIELGTTTIKEFGFLLPEKIKFNTNLDNLTSTIPSQTLNICVSPDMELKTDSQFNPIMEINTSAKAKPPPPKQLPYLEFTCPKNLPKLALPEIKTPKILKQIPKEIKIGKSYEAKDWCVRLEGEAGGITKVITKVVKNVEKKLEDYQNEFNQYVNSLVNQALDEVNKQIKEKTEEIEKTIDDYINKVENETNAAFKEFEPHIKEALKEATTIQEQKIKIEGGEKEEEVKKETTVKGEEIKGEYALPKPQPLEITGENSLALGYQCAQEGEIPSSLESKSGWYFEVLETLTDECRKLPNFQIEAKKIKLEVPEEEETKPEEKSEKKESTEEKSEKKGLIRKIINDALGVAKIGEKWVESVAGKIKEEAVQAVKNYVDFIKAPAEGFVKLVTDVLGLKILSPKAKPCYQPENVVKTIKEQCNILWEEYCTKKGKEPPEICKKIKYTCPGNEEIAAAVQCQELFQKKNLPIPEECSFTTSTQEGTSQSNQSETQSTQEKSTGSSKTQPTPGSESQSESQSGQQETSKSGEAETKPVCPPEFPVPKDGFCVTSNFNPVTTTAEKCKEIKKTEKIKDPKTEIPYPCKILPLFTGEIEGGGETYRASEKIKCPRQSIVDLPFGMGGGFGFKCSLGIPNIPKIELPDIVIPDIILPTFEIPPFVKIKLPRIYTEDLILPDIEICDLSQCAKIFKPLDFQMAQFKLPSLNLNFNQEITLPTKIKVKGKLAEKFSVSYQGKIEFPSIYFSLPKITLLDIVLPKIELPDISLPSPELYFKFGGIDFHAIADLIFTLILNSLGIPDFNFCFSFQIPTALFDFEFPDYYFSFPKYLSFIDKYTQKIEKYTQKIPRFKICGDINQYCKDVRKKIVGLTGEVNTIVGDINTAVGELQSVFDEAKKAIEDGVGAIQNEINSVFRDAVNEIQKELNQSAGIKEKKCFSKSTPEIDIVLKFAGEEKPQEKTETQPQEKTSQPEQQSSEVQTSQPQTEQSKSQEETREREETKSKQKTKKQIKVSKFRDPLNNRIKIEVAIPIKIPQEIIIPQHISHAFLADPIQFKLPNIPLSWLSYEKKFKIQGPGFQPRTFTFELGPIKSRECVAVPPTKGNNPFQINEMNNTIKKLRNLKGDIESSFETIKKILE